MKFFRSISRYFRDAYKSVFRNFALSLASISCITITLIVVALSIVLSYNVEKMTEHVRSNISIVVFLDKDTKDADTKVLKNSIESMDNVGKGNVSFKSKKEYAEETKEYDESFSLIVDSWTDDTIPLLDSFEVKVKNVETIKTTAAEIKKMEHVFSVNFGEEYIESVITIFGVIEKVCIDGVIALILVTAFLIANTIKLAIFSRKTEIEIMRLVGASNVSIRVPFIIEGSFIGVFGAVIPIILMCYGYNAFYNYLGGELFSSSLGKLVEPYPFIFISSGMLLLIGLLVGMFGSQRAVKKYLKI